MSQKPSYIPSPNLRTSLDDFKDYVNASYGLQIESYQDLHSFSVDRLNDFWMSMWRFAAVKGSVQLFTHHIYALDENVPIDQFPKFFDNARLNFAENLLCGDDDTVAVISIEEQNLWAPQKYTWTDLRQMVGTYAAALRSSGVTKGEVVALLGSNCVRSLALLLATASIGGIFASFATDIGTKALGDRVGQLLPRVFFAESNYWYNGKLVNISKKINTCADRIRRKEECQLVVIGDAGKINQESMAFDTFIANHHDSQLRFEQVPFNSPLVIMFSSGTTGSPKGIVHSHGGLVLNGIKEHLLHNGFGANDVYFHFTNIGWTLWNIAIGALLCKSTVVLYDGSPFYPSPMEFVKAIMDNGVTAFGAGPRYYAELRKHDVKPKPYAASLHSILSTGAVLTPALATWLTEAFGPVCQISFSGGTELCGSFMHGTRSLPSYPGQIAVKELGMDIDVFSSDGRPLPEGEAGELVCKKPFPNMPVMFWNDPENKRYKDSYFNAIPHVWTHGDLVKIDPLTKGIYVLGRSDGTLNPSGVRFGSSEIYNILATSQFTPYILDSLVVGQQRAGFPYNDSNERVLLFIKCFPSHTTNSVLPRRELVNRIRKQITIDLSRRHLPEHIFEVDDIPYNANGKKMEIQVRKVVNGGGDLKGRSKISAEELRLVEHFKKFYDLERLIQKLPTGTSKL